MLVTLVDTYKIFLASALFLVLIVLGGGTLWVKHTGFYYCLALSVDGDASNAFKCGNYYFGTYGPFGYDIRKAEYYFGRAVEIDPTTPDAWHQYARTAFLRRDFPTAMYRINRQFEERGDELMASYYIRGLIYGYAKKYPMAEQDFKKFLIWRPTSWAANNDLAWIYFAQGKFTEAKEQSEIGLENYRENVWLLTTHAMAIYNLGDTDGAYDQLLVARQKASQLTQKDWLIAYPGNDPAIAKKGLEELKKTIDKNIELVHSKISSQ